MKSRAYIDYLRLGTWDEHAYLKIVSKMRLLDKGWRPGNWLQYHGQKSEHMFYGVGLQQDRRHYIVQASGELAQMFYDSTIDYGQMFCKRIDVQKTIEEPENYRPLKLYEDFKNEPGNKRNSSIILSDSGSTVYMGSRVSDSYIRVYQKDIEGNPFIRLEIEIKGNTALDVYENLRTETMRITDIYDTIAKRFKLPEYLQTWFETDKDANGSFLLHCDNRYKNNRLQWLGGLGATIIKMGRDHDTGTIVKSWLESWLEQIDT